VRPLKVLIVDDHPVTRDGLRSALATAQDLEVIGEAGTGEEAVETATRLHPDLVFMDVRMPGMGGIEATRAIRLALPDTKVILFTVDGSRAAIAEAIQAGVSGYLLKDMSSDDLVRAARMAMDGKAVIHPALTKVFLDEVRFMPKDNGSPLSPREVQILQHIASGSSTKEVARDLGISVHTVKTHLERIFDKLGANDRAQAVAIALRMGLVQ
jgi:DNA-binding NarL/FixJ family response regulator